MFYVAQGVDENLGKSVVVSITGDEQIVIMICETADEADDYATHFNDRLGLEEALEELPDEFLSILRVLR